MSSGFHPPAISFWLFTMNRRLRRHSRLSSRISRCTLRGHLHNTVDSSPGFLTRESTGRWRSESEKQGQKTTQKWSKSEGEVQFFTPKWPDFADFGSPLLRLIYFVNNRFNWLSFHFACERHRLVTPFFIFHIFTVCRTANRRPGRVAPVFCPDDSEAGFAA
jgi:hypothetical protein